jgi:hypothetical protein
VGGVNGGSGSRFSSETLGAGFVHTDDNCNPVSVGEDEVFNAAYSPDDDDYLQPPPHYDDFVRLTENNTNNNSNISSNSVVSNNIRTTRL